MGDITDDVKYPPEALAADQELLGERSGTTVKVTSNSIIADIAAAAAEGTAAQAALDAHEADVANPHAVTKTQLGLGNVDNTSDAAKPISTATQAALDGKAPLASPTFTGTVTVPDNTAAGQALQIHAFDSATGRLAYEVDGVVFEVGDTGWVDVTADLINSWTADGVFMRRVGARVELGFTQLNGSASTASGFLTLTTGWRCGDGGSAGARPKIVAVAAATGPGTAILGHLGIGGASGVGSEVRATQTWNGAHGAGSWLTEDDWPVSL